MNKIFKVVWSKVKHCYVVVSEIAKNTTSGGARRCRMGKVSLAAAMAAAVLTGSFAMPNEVRAAEIVTATMQNYIAIKGVDSVGDDTSIYEDYQKDRFGNYILDEHYNKIIDVDSFLGEDAEKVIDGYKYILRKIVISNNDESNNDEYYYYWVREGYDIKIVNNDKYFQEAQVNYKVSPYATVSNPSSDHLVFAARNGIVDTEDKTAVNNDILHKLTYTNYVAGTNGGIVVPEGWNYYIYRDDQNGVKRAVDVGTNLTANFKEVTYNSATGHYQFNGEDVQFENVYAITLKNDTSPTIGVFLTSANGNEVYTGPVYGRNNEILVTAYDSQSQTWSTVWGVEMPDPNASIESMTVGQFQDVLDDIHAEDVILSNADIEKTVVDSANGTINLQNKKGSVVPGIGISRSAVQGQNTVITISDADNGTISLETGSRVVANPEENDYEKDGGNVESIAINGIKYDIGTSTGGTGTMSSWKLKVGNETDAYNVKPEDGKDTVTLKADDANGNLTVSRTNGTVTFGFRAVPEFGEIRVGADNKVVINDNGINMNGRKITGLANGEVSGEAVHFGQLPELQDGDANDNVTITAATMNGKTTYTVTGTDTYTTDVTIDGSTNNNAGVRFGRNDGSNGYGLTFVGGENVIVTSDDTNKSITIKATDYKLVQGSDTISATETGYVVDADGTVDLKVQNGTAIETVTIGGIATKSDLQGVTSKVDAGWNLKVEDEQSSYQVKPETGKNTVTLKADDANGNLTVSRTDGTVMFGFREVPEFGEIRVGGNAKVSINDDGITMGGKSITNLAKGVDDNDAVNVGQLPIVVSGSGNVTVTPDEDDATGKTKYAVSVVDNYLDVVASSYDTATKKLMLKMIDGTSVFEADLSGITDGFSTSDYRLVPANETITNTGKTGYVVGVDGTVDLKVQSGEDASTAQTVTIGDIASKSKLDELTTLVGDGNALDGSELSNNSSNTVVNHINNLYSKVENAQNEASIKTVVSAGSNIVVTHDDLGNDYNISLNNIVELKNSINETTIKLDGSNGSIEADSVKVGNVEITAEGIDAGGEKITNVAAGEISATSTDAVNGSQLHNVIESINTSISNARTEVVAGENIKVTETENNGKKTYSVSGTDTIATGNVTVAENGTITLNHVDVDGNTNGKSTVITGLRDYAIDNQSQAVSDGKVTLKVTDKYNSNNTYNVEITDVASASVVGATTKESLKESYKDTTYLKATETKAEDGTIAEDVTESLVEADVKLDKAIKDNADLSYENDVKLQNMINKNDQYLDSRINQLGSKVNKVGAGAAALAALHPMDFDPDDKLSFAVGAGNYAGETATALGAFYRPNEKVMMNVAGTYGNGENMVNMGVSFALDRTNNVSNSRTAMAREIVDLREQVATQGQQIAQLVALVNQLAGVKEPVAPTVQPFPDVPANHWAYEYLNNLVAMGVIEGYPDGAFGGDRTMTRYEFATMLFKAMQNGAVLSEQIRQEFNAELGRVRVDRIKGADDDANKIERVRVNNYEDRDDYGSKIVMVSAGK